MLIALAVIVLVFILASVTAPFWINWLWFGSMGYRSVLVTNYVWELVTFLAVGIGAGALFIANVSFALRNTREGQVRRESAVGRFSQGLIRLLAIAGGILVALVWGWAAKDFWRDILLALRAKEYGVEDPTFHRDISFYLFTLPVFKGAQSGLLALVIVTAVGVGLVYLIRLGVRFGSWGEVPWIALRHLSGLACAILLLVAFGYILRNYEMVYSTRGVVIGPGFTDVNIVRPLNWTMAFVSTVVGLGLLSGVVLKTPRWLAGLLGGWALLALIVTPLLPVMVQRVIVEPNEFAREQKYIERNIEMTKVAFGLDQVETQDLTGQDPIDPSALPADQPPLSNVRIWDYRVVGPVYQQLQSFVPYYEFSDIDVDRYMINGQPTQVLISARELNVGGLQDTAQTWTNKHMAYTHGYGVVVSPVSQVNADGWPVLMVSQIPPTGPAELGVTRPEIYFGELPQEWIIINTDTGEFTGLNDQAGEPRTTGFQGTPAGSISLGNPFTRGLAALTLGDRNVFISSQLTGESRLVMTRSVVDRAERIAPFFEYDADPYLVIADGGLYWVIDGYTSSSRFPQATRFDGENYLRNSVKVVVNAYDGTTTFYRTGMADPIADAYGEVYDDLFTPISEAPVSISSHFRYPERQFRTQSEVWSSYHVESTRSFYDGDDRWTIGEEVVDGNVQQMEPFFVTQNLPNETTTEFALTVPFTPGGGQTRQNMTAWFAGTADENGVTRLRQYRYPRQVTVFGPRQIEAQIAQDPDISQQITLWNQSGTQVIQGNMLVIPVNDAMLYVQPLYLQARGSSAAAPKLVRVIVATKDRVVMRPTLGEAIAALTDPNAQTAQVTEEVPEEVTSGEVTEPTQPNQQATTPSVPPADAELAAMTPEQLIAEAQATYDRAQAAAGAGDWATFGEEQERLGQILELLNAVPPSSGTPEALPVATPAGGG